MDFANFVNQVAEQIIVGSREGLCNTEHQALNAGLPNKELDALQGLIDAALIMVEE